MKTIKSNNSGAALDIAKDIMYSLQVLLVGLFIPFSFVFGITYKMPAKTVGSNISISKQQTVNHQENTVDLGKVIVEKNS